MIIWPKDRKKGNDGNIDIFKSTNDPICLVVIGNFCAGMGHCIIRKQREKIIVNNAQKEGMARFFDGCAVASMIANVSSIFGTLTLHSNDDIMLMLSFPFCFGMALFIRRSLK